MKRLIGGLMLGVGILVMTCSGLCSLLVVVNGLDAAWQNPTIVILPLIFGGIPFLIGLAMYRFGRRLLRQLDT